MAASKPRWIYIAGSGRSGSTMLGLMLAKGSRGFHCGEIHLLWDALVEGWSCECGEEVAHCPVWSEVAARVQRAIGPRPHHELAELMRRVRWDNFFSLRLPRPRSIDIALRRATEHAVEQVTGAPVLVDSSKIPALLAIAARVNRPFDVVHLVRDPRAVAFSMGRAKVDPARGARLKARSTAKSMALWVRTELETEWVIRATQRQSTSPVFSLRYEDLVRDAGQALQPVLGPSAPDVRSGWGDLAERHAVAGNPARFDASAIVVDERWRAQMPRSARIGASLVAAPLLRRYGYRLRG